MVSEKQIVYQLLVLLILLIPNKSVNACPQGFNSTLGRCLLFRQNMNVTWCDANRACAELGAELLTNWTVIVSLSSIFPRSFAWVGVSDLANERIKFIDGWQFVNGRGVMPTNISVWMPGDPNNQIQDCMMLGTNKTGYTGMIDKDCDFIAGTGYVCEIPDPVIQADSCSTKLSGNGRIRWVPASPPNAGAFNDLKKYCFWEKYNVLSLRDCAMIAGFRPYSRSFLYNRNLTLCHVTEFSDSETPYEQLPISWVKFTKG